MTRNRLLFLTVTIFLIACIGSSLGATIYAKNEEAFKTENLIDNRFDQDSVAVAFFTRMRLHDESVFDMIDPALEPSVETWFQTHEPTVCVPLTGHTFSYPSNPNSFASNNGRYVEHYCDIARDNEFWNYIFFLFDFIFYRGDDYHLEIDNIEVVQNENGEWIIIGYGEPKEVFKYSNK